MAIIDDVLDLLKRNLDKMIFNGLQSGPAFPFTVTAEPEPSSYDLKEVIAQSAMLLAVTDVWFIDRPDEHEWFMRTVQPVGNVESHDWRTCYFDPENEVIANEGDGVTDMLRRSEMKKIIWPWICRHPGVWFRWSSGHFTPVAIGDDVSMFNWSRHGDMSAFNWSRHQMDFQIQGLDHIAFASGRYAPQADTEEDDDGDH